MARKQTVRISARLRNAAAACGVLRIGLATAAARSHTVDALKSNCSEFTVWDDAVTGFGVRMRPTGAKSRVIETLDQWGSDYRYVTCDDGCLYILRYDAAREDWGLTMFESACSRTG
jgi:hypothetical protein